MSLTSKEIKQFEVAAANFQRWATRSQAVARAVVQKTGKMEDNIDYDLIADLYIQGSKAQDRNDVELRDLLDHAAFRLEQLLRIPVPK